LYFNGLIDEVRISTGALYSSNFTPAGTLTASSSTKGLWKFDGQTTNDSSANGNNGSLNGGATYSNDVPAAGGGGSAENVSWTNAMGVSSNGNSLTATANGWTAGASSTRAIMSGDGYVQFTASETSSYRMMALSHGDANQSYEELDFAFYLGQNGYLYVYENNVPVYFAGFYATGDTLRIAVESGVVKYRRNGAVVYTSTATPTYPLLADASLSTAGSTINNVVLSGNLGSSASTVQWLVADHLGTPRMILDEWGNLAAMKRHDYLPFGEELLAPTGGRSAAQGYASGDGIRQQFTQKEREVETGLDYFEARYYSPIQGRFTSSDPGKFVPADPQSWNRYSYTQSNPLKYVDLTGKDLYISGDYAEELVKELEKKSGYKLNYDKKSGKVTIDKDVKRQTKGTSKTLASALNLAVTSEHQIPIITVSESKDHVEIIVDSFASRQVDIDDYRAANRDAPDVATGFLTHILTEYTTAAKYPVPYSNEFRFVVSHQIALQEEFKAISDMTRTLTRQGSDTFIGHVAAPPMTIHTDYYSIQYDMIMKSGANGRASQIDKVITTKREPKKK
jgi:RHS repeat-associated protein